VAFPVYFDTCALYGAILKDLFLELAELGAFRPLWSADVLRELEKNLAAKVSPTAARNRVNAMREAFPDALVEGYEALIDTMTCDPKDRHVLAAAVRANAEVVVTFNLRDFPPESTDPFDVEIVHPDGFLLDQFDLYPLHVLRALDNISSAYEAPPMSVDQILDALAHELPLFVTTIRAELD
jgi:predicted nucleic acid-binding protein